MLQEQIKPPVRVDIVYGLSTLGTSALGFISTSWLLYYYAPPDGNALVPVALIGTVIFISRAFSAVISPYIGYLSDNTRSRWGRRLPYMMLAAFPFVAAFVWLWKPPIHYQSHINLIYLGVMAILFRLASAFYHVPYQALLPEIATAEQHRIRISAWQSTFLLLGMMLGGLAGLLIEELNFEKTILIYAATILPLLVLPIFFLRENPNQQHEASHQIGFLQSISLAFRNRAFMVFAMVWAIYLMTTTLVQSSAPFIVTEVCQLSESQTVFFYIPGIIASLAWYPVVTWMARRWGKRKIFMGSYLASAAIFPTTMLMGEWMLISLRAQCVSWAILQAVAISGVVVLSSAFIAEITDDDEGKTGQRREGVYFAVMKVLDQLFSGVAMFLLPIILLLGRSQFSPRGPLGVRMTGVVAGILMFVGFLVFLRYPIKTNQIVANQIERE